MTIDNVAIQVIEEGLVQNLQEILSPVFIGEMKSDLISARAYHSLLSLSTRFRDH